MNFTRLHATGLLIAAGLFFILAVGLPEIKEETYEDQVYLEPGNTNNSSHVQYFSVVAGTKIHITYESQHPLAILILDRESPKIYEPNVFDGGYRMVFLEDAELGLLFVNGDENGTFLSYTLTITNIANDGLRSWTHALTVLFLLIGGGMWVFTSQIMRVPGVPSRDKPIMTPRINGQYVPLPNQNQSSTIPASPSPHPINPPTCPQCKKSNDEQLAFCMWCGYNWND